MPTRTPDDPDDSRKKIPRQRGSEHDDYDIPRPREGTHDRTGYHNPPPKKGGCKFVLLPPAIGIACLAFKVIRRRGR
jgi:hypothetical protein